MDESGLIRKAQEGDQEVFAELFESERPKLERIAYGYLKDNAAAEDAVADAYLKAASKLKTFTDNGKGLSPWLCAIVKNTCTDAIRKNRKWTNLDGIGEGTPTREERDAIPDAIISKEDERLRAEAIRTARANFLEVAREKIRKWTDARRREHGLRIVGDSPRIEKFLDALAATATGRRVGDNIFLYAVRTCAECAEPSKEIFTPEDARAAIKVLEYFRKHFHGSPVGSGYEEIPKSIGALLPLLRPIASRKRTQTVRHQYECITRLGVLRGICRSRRHPNKAICLLLEIAYGGRWTAGKLESMRKRAM